MQVIVSAQDAEIILVFSGLVFSSERAGTPLD
jgi:hypothetical protein